MPINYSREAGRVPAYHHARIEDFLISADEAVIGALTLASSFAVDVADSAAWTEEIRILRNALAGLSGTVLLEFDVPRLGSRIDAVVIVGSALIVIEFKCGAKKHLPADYNQAWDYALDLKNFHSASHGLSIFPILAATEAKNTELYWKASAADGVHPPLRTNAPELGAAVRAAVARASGPTIDARTWARAVYQPSPSIIEAAQSLYARHSVEAISRSDAGAKNLRVTSLKVEHIVQQSRTRGHKSIVFVTGVPGAGKTLVGLNAATQHRREDEPAHAVFLSGNAPLVAVLQEALTRDELARRRRNDDSVRKGAVAQEVKPFIQNIHRFRDEGLRNPDAPPDDHVVIFDEAQRAWNSAKAADFMKRRKKVSGFDQSEAEFLISYMDRHTDWAVIVCLVGGGQEIHTGEAGIASWLDAVRTRFPCWRLFISPQLSDSEYAAGRALDHLSGHSALEFDDDLHLSVSMRSFRAEHVSGFVKALLDSDVHSARSILRSVALHYPMAITRDLDAAKKWIRRHARGSERFGLVASSNAFRLKPHAVEVRVEINPVHWFLAPPDDVRSSYYLEDAATEFQVQGLELDWMLVTWDADLRRAGDGWGYYDFKGSQWRQMKQKERKQYLLNAYRVLLTRARQGMVIFVPPGDNVDPTRPTNFYDETFSYLVELGIPEAQAS
jgi:hypothetical protein